MLYFMMKALTRNDNEWYSFDIHDVPTTFSEDEFVLLNKPGSPILNLKSIKRGDPESGLFEGDIIGMDDCLWVVCYERGFYVINADYVTKHLYQCKEYTLVSNYFEREFPISINTRNKHLFKYKNIIFRIEDIVGNYNKDSIILRTCKHPIKLEDIRQESCMSYKNKRLFLGDVVNGSTVELRGGRVTIVRGDKVIDLATNLALEGL